LAFGASAGSSISGSLSNIYSLVLPEVALSAAQIGSSAFFPIYSSIHSFASYFASVYIYLGLISPAFPLGLIPIPFISSTTYPATVGSLSLGSLYFASWLVTLSGPFVSIGSFLSPVAPSASILASQGAILGLVGSSIFAVSVPGVIAATLSTLASAPGGYSVNVILSVPSSVSCFWLF